MTTDNQKNSNCIRIIGARENNLRNISLDIPRDSLVVITGLSGSGKSSLVFDTLYQEGQRRFMESLSAYARQFLGQMHRPDVDSIEGLSPTLCIDQKTVNRNPRSTVGTITEISVYIRLLLARLGTPHCPDCQTPLVSTSSHSLAEDFLQKHTGKRLEIYAPIVLDRKGEYRKELLQAKQDGYIYARIDGNMCSLDQEIELARYEKHRIELRIDRLKIEETNLRRLQMSLEKAMILGQGVLSFLLDDEYHLLSTKRSCPEHGHNAPELEPRLFSFNAPQGQCATCQGLGYVDDFAFHDMFDSTKGLGTGFLPFQEDGRLPFSHLNEDTWKKILQTLQINPKTIWKNLSREDQDKIIEGSDAEYTYKRHGYKDTQTSWKGLRYISAEIFKYAPNTRLSIYQKRMTCASCQGKRLHPVALSVRFQGENIDSFSSKSISDLYHFFQQLQLTPSETIVGEPIIRQLLHRIEFLEKVGLGYLSLHRSANTLSGGESQRIRLAAQMGSGLQGVTYILDEPSIGLHHRDQLRLLSVLENLRDKGNSLLVVEHDPLTISYADHCIEIGPGSGKNGGHVVTNASRKNFIRAKNITAEYLRGDKFIPIPTRRTPSRYLSIYGASGNNLQHVDVQIPLDCFVVVTGVSGSGKSTLIQDTLCAILDKHLYNSKAEALPYEKIEGIDQINKLISIDQKPIGRSSRSNPATYTKVFDIIRDLFAQTSESKRRGYKASRFSFNVHPSNGGGRCEDCEGAGTKTIDMQFLNSVELPCESCNGQRFNDETLQVRYNGKNIYEVLDMTIEDSVEFFTNQPKIKHIVQILQDIGLGYIKLGQPSTTLSGGEAQRIKLASELHRPTKGHTLYVFDEPSTGLHMADVHKLVDALQQLVTQNNTVLIVEHDLDIIKVADHIIDLGPEGGVHGGKIIAYGTPEEIANHDSPTAKALQTVLFPTLDKKDLAYNRKYTKNVQHQNISILEANTHNLKNISVEIPQSKLTVITGPSGSGKSSLAFHTIFAEGQLRYVESLSTYARQFLGSMQRPPVGKIEGLTPAIAIDQSNRSHSARSTVATSTELYDLLRLLYAKVGTPHCPTCHMRLQACSPSQAAIQLQATTQKGMLVAKTDADFTTQHLLSDGITRIVDNNTILQLDTLPSTTSLHAPTIVLDRFTPSKTSRERIASSMELAYSYGKDVAYFVPEENTPILFTREHRCPEHNYVLPKDISPRFFSFNARIGACITCEGLGTSAQIDWNKLFPDPHQPFWDAIQGWVKASFSQSAEFTKSMEKWFKKHKLTENTAPNTYTEKQRQEFLLGEENSTTNPKLWEGITAKINRWNNDATWLRSTDLCPSCNGQRLRPEVLAIHIAGKNISEVCTQTIQNAQNFWKNMAWTDAQSTISKQIMVELHSRLQFLSDVGLEYLSLDRPAHTLSGGETQRIRLASQLGSHLTRTLYVLDEPTIGLHPRNTEMLLHTLRKLQSFNNTVILVEHDLQVIEQADHVVELGPRSGEYGGEVMASTDVETLKSIPCLTGEYLSKKKTIATPTHRRLPTEWIHVPKFSKHNIENMEVSIPKNALTVVTGVSGSGKSTLVFEGFLPHLQENLTKHQLHAVHVVDQSPINASPRSTTASYTGVLDKIRDIFAKTTTAKQRGWNQSYFSYNVNKGRCPDCEGKGYTLVEMHFISDVWVECATCQGSRYNEATLEVQWNDKNIADILDCSVDEALEFFQHHKAILQRLQALHDVGLGYLRLGQPNNELSGGELQRLKLASEFAKGNRAKASCFILDEPTTGLHIDDVQKLVQVLDQLVELGHTVVVIEHNLDVMKTADHIIDIGPEGGMHGGKLVFAGSPTELLQSNTPSHTKRFLQQNMI